MQPMHPGEAVPRYVSAAPLKKRSAGKIVGGCLGALLLTCCCFSGLGGYVAFRENRSLYTPGDEVARTPMTPGVPTTVQASFDGSGYAFAQIWVELDAQQTGPELNIRGRVDCSRGPSGGSYPESVNYMVWEHNARVSDFVRSGDRVTASVMLHDEYMRAGDPPRPCVVDVGVDGGTLTSASVVVRTYQRPSDRFAN